MNKGDDCKWLPPKYTKVLTFVSAYCSWNFCLNVFLQQSAKGFVLVACGQSSGSHLLFCIFNYAIKIFVVVIVCH